MAESVPSKPDSGQLVPFGFRDLSPEAKTEAVGEVFHRVASRYDLMNDVMSGGLHRRWKRHFVQALRPQPHEHVLDLAGGTGDIAFRIAARGAQVTVADINPDMLAVGQTRAERRGLSQLEFVEANAEELPFDDQSFDAVTIAFGIRNVTHIDQALREMHRVLKWGGRFFCLEFSTCEWPGFAKLYDAYTLKLVPKMGRLVAGDEDSYRYLAESINRFPGMAEFAGMVREAGFRQVKAQPILGGAVAVHSGWKI